MRLRTVIPMPRSAASVLAVVSLMVGLAYSTRAAIWSMYLDSFVANPALVGALASIFTAVVFIVSLASTSLLERFRAMRLWLFSVMVMFFAASALFAAPVLWVAILAGIVMYAAQTTEIQSRSILVRNTSTEGHAGENWGLQYALSNVGWLVAPLIGGFIASEYGVSTPFLFMVVLFLMSWTFLRTSRIPLSEMTGEHHSVLANVSTFFSSTERRIAYALFGLLEVYWYVIYIYVPLVLITTGYSVVIVGAVLSVMVIPLVLLEYPLGRWTDRHGYRKTFVIGFGILTLGALSMALAPSVPLMALFAVLTSSGAAFLEASIRAYFFDTNVGDDGARYFGVLSTGAPIFATFSMLLASVVVAVFWLQAVFFLLVASQLIGVLLSLRVKAQA